MVLVWDKHLLFIFAVFRLIGAKYCDPSLNITCINLCFLIPITSEGIRQVDMQRTVFAAYLAVHHINTYNSNVVNNIKFLGPQFGLDIIMHDTESTVKGGLNAMIQCLREKYAVMIGPGRSLVASPISLYHDIQEIPLISYWATAPSLVVDRGYFMRTIPSDSISVGAMVDFAISNGWKHIAIVYTDDTYGRDYRHSLVLECANKNIFLDYEHAFSEQDQDSIDAAARRISQQTTRIVILLVFESDVEFFFQKADEYGVIGERTYLCTDTLPEVYRFEDGLEWLKPLLNGIIRFFPTIEPGAPGKNRFDDEWSKTNVENIMNKESLPFIDCKNYTCAQDKLNKYSPGSVASFIYDAVVAAGLALNQAPSKWENGSHVLSILKSTEFSGASGNVKFTETGDRSPSTASVTIENFRDGAFQVIGFWHLDTNLTLNPDAIIHWSNGKRTPPDPAPIDILPPRISNVRRFQESDFILILVFVIVSLIICIMALILCFIYRKAKAFRSGSAALTSASVVGCFMMNMAVLLNLFATSIYTKNLETRSSFCQARYWFAVLGVQLAFICLFLKLYRLYKIFLSRKLQVVLLKTRWLMGRISLTILVDIVLLSIWNVVAPDETIKTQAMCVSHANVTPFHWIFGTIKGTLILATFYLYHKTKNLPRLYRESYFMAMAIYNIVALGVVYIAISIMARNNETAIIYGQSFTIMTCATLLVVALVHEKLANVFLGKQQEKQHLSRAKSTQDSNANVHLPLATYNHEELSNKEKKIKSEMTKMRKEIEKLEVKMREKNSSISHLTVKAWEIHNAIGALKKVDSETITMIDLSSYSSEQQIGNHSS